MEHEARHIIDALGGITAVSRLTEAPVSTVHSWLKTISASRLAHLRLLARDHGVTLPVVNEEAA